MKTESLVLSPTKNLLSALAALTVLGSAGSAAAGTLVSSGVFGGATYSVYKADRPISWEDAAAAAVGLGGHLATIGGAGENAFIYSLIDGHGDLYVSDAYNRLGPWLGAKRAAGHGAFSWIDGTPFIYQNWSSGEPNNCCGGEDYLEFFAAGTDPVNEPNEGSYWNDLRPGLGVNSYVVEVPGGVPEPTIWALMITGFGGMGAILRRRRAATA